MGQEHWIQLTLTPGLGPVLIGRMVKNAGSAQAACGLRAAELALVEGIGTARAGALAAAVPRAAEGVEAQLRAAAASGARIITLESPDYPPLLKSIYDPPPVLYWRGTLEDRDLYALAMVGSRRCTIYGREQAQRFGALAAAVGLTVVSGGARGIDSAAHEGALRQPGGRTIAVVGSGLDQPYPRENGPLFDRIAGNGAVVSEFPFGTPPSAENFPRRNRVISGLSRGVLVIEADERSGALITARVAADDQNRPVMALPGRVDSPMSAGTHQLIRDGAALVRNLDDILAELGPLPDLFAAAPPPVAPGAEATAKAAGTISAEQEALLAALADGPLTVDQMVDRTGLEAGVILRELTFLSLRARVRRADGQAYELRRQETA
jgi:DNA processing protein